MSRMKELAERTHTVKFNLGSDLRIVTKIRCSKNAKINSLRWDSKQGCAVMYLTQERLVLHECEREVVAHRTGTPAPSNMEHVGVLSWLDVPPGWAVYITPVPE